MKKRIQPSNMNSADVSIATIGSKKEAPPQLLMMGDEKMPTMTDSSTSNQIEWSQIGKDGDKD